MTSIILPLDLQATQAFCIPILMRTAHLIFFRRMHQKLPLLLLNSQPRLLEMVGHGMTLMQIILRRDRLCQYMATWYILAKAEIVSLLPLKHLKTLWLYFPVQRMVNSPLQETSLIIVLQLLKAIGILMELPFPL